MGHRSLQLDAQVTARIPVRTNHDDRYFTDHFQSMPKHRFTRMFENMLNHGNIDLALGADYCELRDEVDFGQIIYSGPIDEFFDYRFGKLPYRSLHFEHQTFDRNGSSRSRWSNYPNEHDYTHHRVQAPDRPAAHAHQCGLRISTCGREIPIILPAAGEHGYLPEISRTGGNYHLTFASLAGLEHIVITTWIRSSARR